MKNKEIYVDDDGFYYYIGQIDKCEGCKSDLLKNFFYVRHFVSKRENFNYPLCEKCLREKKFKMLPIIAMETYLVSVVNKIDLTQKIRPVTFGHPFKNLKPLSDSRGEEFSLFDVDKIGGKTIDHTRLAGRESFEGLQIGKSPVDAIEGKDNLLDVDDGLKLLDGLAKSKPLIEERKVKQLE